MALTLSLAAHSPPKKPPLFGIGAIWGIPLLAGIVTAAVIGRPELLPVVLALDLWLLGYHHVIATYTRTAMDGEMLRKHWRLNLALPPLVFAAVLSLGLAGGAIAITTVYIHWQLYHYVRQSEGISKAIGAGAGARDLPGRWAVRASFYLVPLTSFLTMAQVPQRSFLGFAVWLPTLPVWFVAALWIVTCGFLLAAAFDLGRRFKAGGVNAAYLQYLVSHLALFILAYAVIRDVVLSWLMANIWHNTQYLLFVHRANQQRFNKGPKPMRAPVLSILSQPRMTVMYFLFCLAVTAVVYSGLADFVAWLTAQGQLDALLIAAVVYQTVNFHHYIVDAVIWRRPQMPVRGGALTLES